MKVILIVITSLLFIGCAQEDPKVNLVKRFWQAMDTNDAETLRQVLSDPKQAEFLAGGSVGLALESYEVLESTKEGVNVKFARHCYPDVIVPTVVSEKNNMPKIDLMATFKSQMKQMAAVKPTEKYCYEFQDQPLKGLINGKPWEAHHIDRQVIDFGTRKEESFSIVAEECPEKNCLMLSSPKILISRLDLSSDGGNLDNSRNITIFTPPSDNKMVSQGSYRVSSTANGKTKLEISVKENDGDTINGYIIY